MSCPHPASNSYLQIDAFILYDLFDFEMLPPQEIATEVRDYSGSLHVISRVFLDQFRFTFPKLTQAQFFQLNLILQSTSSPLHTIIYSTPTLIRKWDNSTNWASGYGINDDVQRKRKKVRIRQFTPPHWPNVSNFYSIQGEGIEA